MLIVAISFQPTVLSQTENKGLSVSGKALDSETQKPIHNANVYISGTTIGTATDADGKFLIPDLNLGRYSLVISHVAYELQVFDLTLLNKDVDLGEVKLSIKVQGMLDIEVSARKDNEWKKEIKRFKRSVFGENYEPDKIHIPNEYNLEYQYSDIPTAQKRIKANKYPWMKLPDKELVKGNGISLSEPFDFEIHNYYTGYVIDYSVQDFYVGDQTEEFIYGYMRFSEMETTDEDEKEAWLMNREKSYHGSLTHFLKSLIDGQHVEEGFEARITTLNPFKSNKKRMIRKAKVDTLRGKNVEGRFKISSTEFPNVKKIEFTDYLEFEYWLEADKKGKLQKSWLMAKDDVILVYTNGVLIDPTSVYLFGHLTKEGLYEALPINYSPLAKN